MKLEFTADLETGVPNIDEQHKELIKRINDVVALGGEASKKEDTDRLIGFLEEYVLKHFRDEEQLQRNSGYPKYEWHRGQHEEYIRNLAKLKEEYAKNGPSLSFTIALNSSVIEWIVRHIRSVDKELGAHINDKG
ncbi:MAG: hemerythrin family protein [Treponema sp.]|nr:hemerythrin family protein [Treponema sp.]